MKKIIAFVLAAIMMLTLLAGCSNGNANTEKKEGLENFKIGFIFLHDENSTYDKNFIDAAKTACANLGLSEDQILMKTNIPESNECYEAALDLADLQHHFRRLFRP